MPVPKRGPVWRSPSPESKRRESRRAGKCPHGKDVGDNGDDGGDDEMEDDDAKQRLMNQISRHRDDVSVLLFPHSVRLHDPGTDKDVCLSHSGKGQPRHLNTGKSFHFPTCDVSQYSHRSGQCLLFSTGTSGFRIHKTWKRSISKPKYRERLSALR
jgi:hypothetical protein